MRSVSDPKFLPYLRKKWPVYFLLAVISLVLVLLYNQRLTEFFVSRSKVRAVVLFFLLPLLAILTRPYGRERAVGIIYAIQQKEWRFFITTLGNWLLTAAGSFGVSMLLYYRENYAQLVGFANWVYLFSFLALLLNLFPIPPISTPKGASLPITVWGPRKSGKTVYFGMLFDDLLNKKWAMDPTGEDAYKYIDKIRGTLAGNQWPQNTEPQYDGKESAESFTFHFSRRWPWYPYFGRRYFSIRMPDPSGELFQEVEGVDTTELPAIKQTYFQNMVQSAGALFIIDIQSSDDTETLKKQMAANISHLQYIHFPDQPGRKLEFPVAIAVSQVDRVYDEYRKNIKQPDQWFQQKFGPNLYRLLQQRIQDFRIFYYSAVGVKEENGRMIPRTHIKDGEEIPDTRLQPFGLFEPVKWLLYRSKRYMAKQRRKNAVTAN
jgi:hypothetical protein